MTAPFDDMTAGHRVGDLVTSTGLKNDTLELIWIFSPEIPTKSGIRVGDTLETLQKTFPDLGDPVPAPGDVSVYAIDGTAGRVLFDVAYPGYEGADEGGILTILDMRVIPKGADIPTWGGDAGGSCKA